MEDLTNISKKEVTSVDMTMKDFSEAIDRSFKDIEEGDIITGTVVDISDTNVVIDLDYYAEGSIPLEELSNDPNFKIKDNIKIGETLSAMVYRMDDGEGNLLLSLKRAQNILSWDILKEGLESKSIYHVIITDAVNAGVITYVEGIRAFIPASQLALEFIEEPESYVGQEVDAIIIEIEPKNKKLILSVKEVLKMNAISERNNHISRLQRGSITTGIVEKIVPYGIFIKMNDTLNGLVHISEICNKFISTPKEVVKLGESVTVKIIDIKDGKISLSMKAVEDTILKSTETTLENPEENMTEEYSSHENASTNLGSLLSNLKF